MSAQMGRPMTVEQARQTKELMSKVGPQHLATMVCPSPSQSPHSCSSAGIHASPSLAAPGYLRRTRLQREAVRRMTHCLCWVTSNDSRRVPVWLCCAADEVVQQSSGSHAPGAAGPGVAAPAAGLASRHSRRRHCRCGPVAGMLLRPLSKFLTSWRLMWLCCQYCAEMYFTVESDPFR